ncbi:SDR family oxidoreductase [Hyphomicrobium sp. MC8b]|uniref:SDR family oxidoreductase n=1 Tax=Hyphomicrobium sp. MC8b TaxID=300273 RepID=UPI0039187481
MSSCRAADPSGRSAPQLREDTSAILNTSFVAQTGKHGISLTAAAKAALRSLARTWSFEFLDRKIRVNAHVRKGMLHDRSCPVADVR